MSGGCGVALAHHWMVTFRGGERVLAHLAAMWPEAPIHTLVADRGRLPAVLAAKDIRESWLGRVPGARRLYPALLPLHPLAVRSLRAEADLVVVSDAALMKGIRVPREARLLCYCHSPPRYLWGMEADYLAGAAVPMGAAGRAVFQAVAPGLRRWDQAAASRVDAFACGSAFVRERIRRCYGRDAEVVPPPVDDDAFVPPRPAEDFYLLVSQLTPYKNVGLAVEAFNGLGRRLIVIGEGPEALRLRARAGGTVTFLGWQPREVVRDYFSRCRALVFPGVEDFGITPLEAHAAGRPVVALRRGGVVETVVDGATGAFFDQPNAASLAAAIRRVDEAPDAFRPEACQARAREFSSQVFRARMARFVAAHTQGAARGKGAP